MDPTTLHSLLVKYHLKPTKALGQHYLLDEAILAATIEAANIQPQEPILELGAGPGILTKALAEAGAEVLAVEYDAKFCRLLQEEFHNWRNIHVLCDDALRLDFESLETKTGRPYKKIVANIPYQITNPLVRRILEPGSPIEMAVLLIQKEVADRLMAQPGSSERGLLTLMVERYGRIEKIIDVPSAAFWPAPAVNSAVIKITRQPVLAAEGQDDAAFFWLVKQGFSGKRKTVVNSLAGGLHLSKTETLHLLSQAAVEPANRAEDLILEQWERLFTVYKSEIVKGES